MNICVGKLSKFLIFTAFFYYSVNCDSFDNYCWVGNVIPYNLTEQYFDAFQTREIEKAIEIFHKQTCVRWVKLDWAQFSDKHYAQFTKIYDTDKCRINKTEIGENKYAVLIELSDSCFSKGLILQTMMQALGFPFEHQRPDRGCFIEFSPAAEYDAFFQKKKIDPSLLRYPYDTDSVMQYKDERLQKGDVWPKDGRSFSNSGNRLSKLDLSKILYKFCGKSHFCHLHGHACETAAAVGKPCIAKDS